VKIKLGFLGVLVLVLLVGVTAAMAGREELRRHNLPTAGPGELYLRTDLWPDMVLVPVALPSPGPDDNTPRGTIGGESGSLSAVRNSTIGASPYQPLGNRAFTSQVGNSVPMSKQKVNHQIAKLIRRFD
jgi:hypothetical protein